MCRVCGGTFVASSPSDCLMIASGRRRDGLGNASGSAWRRWWLWVGFLLLCWRRSSSPRQRTYWTRNSSSPIATASTHRGTSQCYPPPPTPSPHLPSPHPYKQRFAARLRRAPSAPAGRLVRSPLRSPEPQEILHPTPPRGCSHLDPRARRGRRSPVAAAWVAARTLEERPEPHPKPHPKSACTKPCPQPFRKWQVFSTSHTHNICI